MTLGAAVERTAEFLIPPQYRVLESAFLYILLGILAAISKKCSQKLEISEITA